MYKLVSNLSDGTCCLALYDDIPARIRLITSRIDKSSIYLNFELLLKKTVLLFDCDLYLGIPNITKSYPSQTFRHNRIDQA